MYLIADYSSFVITDLNNKSVTRFNRLKKKVITPVIIACLGKIAAPVKLKLFINGNEKCHTTDAHSLAHERISFVM